MKISKAILSFLLPIILVGVVSCGETPTKEKQKEYYTLPDIYNDTVVDAKLKVNAQVFLEPIEVESSLLMEGRVLGYRKHEAGEQVEKGTRLAINVAVREEKSISYDDPVIDYVTEIAKVTGANSTNADLCREHGQAGTDLGIPFELPDGRMMLLYGDTFSVAPMSGRWNSNFMAITSDFNLADGLTFDDIVHNDDNEMMIPFQEGAHQGDNQFDKNVEVTKIPTGGISIGNDVYIFYMSIRFWGGPTGWLVTYNQCVKATDNTYKKWNPVTSLKWTDDEFYYGGQIYPFKDPKDEENIYFTSIPGGRNDGAVMFRVNKNKFEDRNEYEYLIGADTWVKGDKGMDRLNKNPYYVLSPSVSEPSIMYSKYLNKYIYSTLKGANIVFALSDKVSGPYDDIHVVCRASNFSGLYGGFVHEKFTDYDGQRIFIQLSRWTPIYNPYVIAVNLK